MVVLLISFDGVLLVLFVGCFTWCDVGGCSPRCGFERLVVLFGLV